MGAAIGSDQGGRSVNVELNIVPFIDLMSCLTAFLLVTAVWINMANIKNEAAGKRMGAPDPDKQIMTVLIEADQITATQLPEHATYQIPGNDWAKLETALVDFRAAGGETVEIAAESSDEHPISYQTLIAAMDTTIAAGFPHVGVTDPRSLSR